MSLPCVRMLVVALLLGFAAPCLGGDFTFVIGGDTLDTNPPRVRIWFGLYNAHFGERFCELRIEPSSYAGSPIRPVLDCTASSRLTCHIDSLGAAIFDADPCLGGCCWVIADSLTLTVDGLPAYFETQFITEGGYVRKTSNLYAPADLRTALRRPTWGSLKARFR